MINIEKMDDFMYVYIYIYQIIINESQLVCNFRREIFPALRFTAKIPRFHSAQAAPLPTDLVVISERNYEKWVSLHRF